MRNVTITIECDNAAFDDTPMQEVSRILRKLANDIEAFEQLNDTVDTGRILRDLNGNRVGRYTFEEVS